MTLLEPVLYAVGDIHGRHDHLLELQTHILNHHEFFHSDRAAHIIYVGDYIDRGPHSAEVLDQVMRGMDGFETTCLLGNHEAMLLECLATDNPHAWHTWLSNGGDATLESLGLQQRFGEYDPNGLYQVLGADRVSWLRSLPLYLRTKSYLFVHAGIAPGVSIEDQMAKDLLWIRGRFLDDEREHGMVVVHGHTPSEEPVVRPNRICVDTFTGPGSALTAAVLNGSEPPIFLRSTG
ncbi:MAG: metallophosphoesterase family protein [Pseudomonadota bacterium]